MIESDYMVVANIVRVRILKDVLRNTDVHPQWGLSDEDRTTIFKILRNAEDRLQRIIEAHYD